MAIFDATKEMKDLLDPVQFRINDKTYTVAEKNGGIITNKFINEVLALQVGKEEQELVMAEQLENLCGATPGAFADVDVRIVQNTLAYVFKQIRPEGIEVAAKN